MSRLYGMSIKITEYDEKKTRAILDALKQEWDIDNESCHDVSADENYPRFLSAYGESYLCGGESEEEFADRVALAVWKANAGFCHIQVEAIYLEDLPWELHIRDEDDYYRMTKSEERE